MKRLFAAGASASLLLLLFALPASAADLTGGCILEVTSFEGTVAEGAELDGGQAPGPVGSQSDPFLVDFFGDVDFLFRTPTVFENNHWAVQVESIPVLAGSDDNPGDTDEKGVVSIAGESPFGDMRIVGLFHVTGDLWGNNDAVHCHGDGWVRLVGDPVGTIPWVAAVGLLVSGLIGLVATPYGRNWEVDPLGGERLHSGPLPPPEA